MIWSLSFCGERYSYEKWYIDKHKKIKEGVEFIKKKDYAVINFNNMIPVPDSQIVDIDIKQKI